MLIRPKYRYQKTTADNGDIIYSKKHDFKKTAKEIVTKNMDIDTIIKDLKSELSDKVKYRKTISLQATDPRKKADLGIQLKGRTEDLKNNQKEIDDIIRKLNRLGVGVNRKALSRDKIVYEGGHFTMFKSEDITRMKLDVFEESAAGKISDDFRDYCLVLLEAVSKNIAREEAYCEAVENIISAQRDNFVTYIKESHNAGLISAIQAEVMLELANDDFMFEAPTPDKLPDLVKSYLEAAKEGDEEKKEAIKKQIDTAKELKEIASPEEDVVTEGADCSIVEKLEALKVKLSKEEREMAERFDEMIAAGGECKEEPAKEEKEEKNEPVEEGKKSEEEKAEEPVEGEEVKESTMEREIGKMFESVVIESSVTEDEGTAMVDYMTEAVADGVYSEEDLARVKRLLSK